MKVQKNENIIVQRNSNGDIIFYDPESGNIHMTNEIGYLIFILCEHYTVKDIAMHIHILTGHENVQRIMEDINTFIRDLISKGYLLKEGDSE
ncbi:PqqD family protein [Thermococcus prieurii]